MNMLHVPASPEVVDEARLLVTSMDDRFRSFTGAVDLLEMSRIAQPDYFHAYIQASRLIRGYDRLAAQLPA